MPPVAARSHRQALFVIPLMVLCGWAMGQPLDLFFGTFETSVTFLSTVSPHQQPFPAVSSPRTSGRVGCGMAYLS